MTVILFQQPLVHFKPLCPTAAAAPNIRNPVRSTSQCQRYQRFATWISITQLRSLKGLCWEPPIFHLVHAVSAAERPRNRNGLSPPDRAVGKCCLLEPPVFRKWVPQWNLCCSVPDERKLKERYVIRLVCYDDRVLLRVSYTEPCDIGQQSTEGLVWKEVIKPIAVCYSDTSQERAPLSG